MQSVHISFKINEKQIPGIFRKEKWKNVNKVLSTVTSYLEPQKLYSIILLLSV